MALSGASFPDRFQHAGSVETAYTGRQGLSFSKNSKNLVEQQASPVQADLKTRGYKFSITADQSLPIIRSCRVSSAHRGCRSQSSSGKRFDINLHCLDSGKDSGLSILQLLFSFIDGRLDRAGCEAPTFLAQYLIPVPASPRSTRRARLPGMRVCLMSAQIPSSARTDRPSRSGSG